MESKQLYCFRKDWPLCVCLFLHSQSNRYKKFKETEYLFSVIFLLFFYPPLFLKWNLLQWVQSDYPDKSKTFPIIHKRVNRFILSLEEVQVPHWYFTQPHRITWVMWCRSVSFQSQPLSAWVCISLRVDISWLLCAAWISWLMCLKPKHT